MTIIHQQSSVKISTLLKQYAQQTLKILLGQCKGFTVVFNIDMAMEARDQLLTTAPIVGCQNAVAIQWPQLLFCNMGISGPGGRCGILKGIWNVTRLLHTSSMPHAEGTNKGPATINKWSTSRTRDIKS